MNLFRKEPGTPQFTQAIYDDLGITHRDEMWKRMYTGFTDVQKYHTLRINAEKAFLDSHASQFAVISEKLKNAGIPKTEAKLLAIDAVKKMFKHDWDEIEKLYPQKWLQRGLGRLSQSSPFFDQTKRKIKISTPKADKTVVETVVDAVADAVDVELPPIPEGIVPVLPPVVGASGSSGSSGSNATLGSEESSRASAMVVSRIGSTGMNTPAVSAEEDMRRAESDFYDDMNAGSEASESEARRSSGSSWVISEIASEPSLSASNSGSSNSRSSNSRSSNSRSSGSSGSSVSESNASNSSKKNNNNSSENTPSEAPPAPPVPVKSNEPQQKSTTTSPPTLKQALTEVKLKQAKKLKGAPRGLMKSNSNSNALSMIASSSKFQSLRNARESSSEQETNSADWSDDDVVESPEEEIEQEEIEQEVVKDKPPNDIPDWTSEKSFDFDKPTEVQVTAKKEVDGAQPEVIVKYKDSDVNLADVAVNASYSRSELIELIKDLGYEWTQGRAAKNEEENLRQLVQFIYNQIVKSKGLLSQDYFPGVRYNQLSHKARKAIANYQGKKIKNDADLKRVELDAIAPKEKVIIPKGAPKKKDKGKAAEDD